MNPADDQKPEDLKLIRFLQQHRPPVPPSAPDLEDRILEAIRSAELAPLDGLSVKATAHTRSQVVPFSRSSRRFWLVSTGIAASLVAGLVSYRLLLPPQPNAAEIASLEAFIEANWQSTVNGNSDAGTEELFPTSDTTN